MSPMADETWIVLSTVRWLLNPNCKAKKWMTHSTANCYWPGGGKEGQFPPNFRQRARANVISSNQNMIEHFILSARVPDTLGNLGIIINDDDDEVTTTIALISKSFQGFSKGKVSTFINSGASDTMFILRNDFNNYKLMPLHSGDSAKAVDGDFEIIGEGSL
jgi:hypothetical protein